jgi:hypothetical protein
MFSLFTTLITELNEFSTQQTALTRQLAGEKRETIRLASAYEGGINALSTRLSSISESLAFLPVFTKEVRNDVLNINNTLLAAQQSFITSQKLTSDQLSESSRQNAQLCSSINTLFEANRSVTSVHSQISEALENLHDDTVEQKDRIIEMVLVMQHILQAQLDPQNEIRNNITLIQNNEKKI